MFCLFCSFGTEWVRRCFKLKIYELAKEVNPYVVEMRRYFHEHPELSNQEDKTIERIGQELAGMGIEYEVVPHGGIVAILEGKTPGKGKTVLLRADCDALPVQETKENLAGPRVCCSKVDVLLAPAASVIYPENVPANAPLLDEDAYLDQLSAAVQAAGGRFVDVRQTLAEHKDEYIYYRTDHHWTSLGAYYAYQQLCGTLSLTPFDPAAHTALTAENFYGTHYSKARTWNAVPDTITYYDLPNSLTIYNVTAAGQPADGQTTGLYDTDKLNVYDKYAMFLHGNNGLSRIEGDGTGRILVIKDSYANCFAPYLTANYAQIDVVDFRNYNYGLDQLIADNDYDQILVLYSFDSFKSDPYLYRAGVAG